MGNELLNLQRLAFGRIAQQRNGFLRTFGDTHTTAHTGSSIDRSNLIIHRDCRELAIVGAEATGSAQVGVYLGHVAGGSEHGGAVPVGLHGAAAAGTAVADGIEPIEHRVLVLVDTIEHVPSL